jgi:hypothetical protein
MLAVSFFFSDGDLPNVIFLDSLLQFENSTWNHTSNSLLHMLNIWNIELANAYLYLFF